MPHWALLFHEWFTNQNTHRPVAAAHCSWSKWISCYWLSTAVGCTWISEESWQQCHNAAHCCFLDILHPGDYGWKLCCVRTAWGMTVWGHQRMDNPTSSIPLRSAGSVFMWAWNWQQEGEGERSDMYVHYKNLDESSMLFWSIHCTKSFNLYFQLIFQ